MKVLLYVLALAAIAGSATAQTYPDKPIRLVLSQPAGSGPDNVGRIISDRLTKQMGQTIVVDNKPGGQNQIGAQNAGCNLVQPFQLIRRNAAMQLVRTGCRDVTRVDASGRQRVQYEIEHRHGLRLLTL